MRNQGGDVRNQWDRLNYKQFEFPVVFLSPQVHPLTAPDRSKWKSQIPLDPCLKTPLLSLTLRITFKILGLACKIILDQKPFYLYRFTFLCICTYCHLGSSALSFPLKISAPVTSCATFSIWSNSLVLFFLGELSPDSEYHRSPRMMLRAYVLALLTCDMQFYFFHLLLLTLFIFGSSVPNTTPWHTVSSLNACEMASWKVQRNVFGNCKPNQSPVHVWHGV